MKGGGNEFVSDTPLWVHYMLAKGDSRLHTQCAVLQTLAEPALVPGVGRITARPLAAELPPKG